MSGERDHGGNLDAAMQRYGGVRAAWLDLSTGINPKAYPVPHLDPESWSALPQRAELDALCETARASFETEAEVVAFAGAQAAIQAVPSLAKPASARVLGPTYNEHAATLTLGGWQVSQVADLAACEGCDLAVVVNPNNPDGQHHPQGALRDLAGRVGLLIIDESFVDCATSWSLAPCLHEIPNAILLRSFGKFYGLAGLRVGFALATGKLAAELKTLAGPWPISGPAIAIATQAYRDTDWRAQTAMRLSQDANRLDELATGAGWGLVGGTSLFRTYTTPDAAVAQARLASHRVWSRIFPYSTRWLRLGLPGREAHWAQLAKALSLAGVEDRCP